MEKNKVVSIILLILLLSISIVILISLNAIYLGTNKNLEIITREIKDNRAHLDRQTNIALTLVEQNQLKLEETMSELISRFEDQYINLDKNILENNNLLASYIAHAKTIAAADNQYIVNNIVESDHLIQQLLGKGKIEYKEKNYTGAVNIYKQILEINSSNTEALCYYNAALHYQNPGDGTIFSGIKKVLISLLKDKSINKHERSTVLNVLISISREEGNKDSQQEYTDALDLLEDNL